MRIHADITRTTAIAISDIKKLLVKHFGEMYNDTGHVLGYCVSCTIQALNDHYAAEKAKLQEPQGELDDDKVSMERGIPAEVQDGQVDRSRPAGNTEHSDSAGNSGPGSSGTVD